MKPGLAGQALEDDVRHGRAQVRLADAAEAHAVEPREAQAGIGRQLDRLVPHRAVAVDGHHRGVFFVQQLLERQGQLARLEDLVLGRLDDLDRAGDPAVGLRLGRVVVDRVVRLLHALETDLLDLRAELGLDLGGVLTGQAGGDVEDLGLAQVVDRPERPDRRRQLLAVAGEHAVQQRAFRLLLHRAEAAHSWPGVGHGEEHRRPAGLAGSPRGSTRCRCSDGSPGCRRRPSVLLDRLDLLGRGDQLIDDELDVGQFIFQGLERGLVGPDFGLEIQFRSGPAASRDGQVEPRHLHLRPPATRTDQCRCARSRTPRAHAGASESQGGSRQRKL